MADRESKKDVPSAIPPQINSHEAQTKSINRTFDILDTSCIKKEALAPQGNKIESELENAQRGESGISGVRQQPKQEVPIPQNNMIEVEPENAQGESGITGIRQQQQDFPQMASKDLENTNPARKREHAATEGPLQKKTEQSPRKHQRSAAENGRQNEHTIEQQRLQSLKMRLQKEMSPGELHDKYRMSETELGKGGCGKVYLGQTLDGQQQVAIKVMPLGEQTKRTWLHYEISVPKYYSHNNIIQYLDSYIFQDTNLAVVLEFINGMTLHRLSTRFKLPTDIMATICEGVLLGLQHLHSSHKIAHCDLKPANILLGTNGEVKIIDFGRSKTDDHEGNYKHIGTIPFMSPETQNCTTLTNNICKLDIWALGMIVIQMITTREPYHDVPKDEREERVAKSVIPTIKEELHPDTKDFLDRCLEHDPRKRATAPELLCHKFLTQARTFKSLGNFLTAAIKILPCTKPCTDQKK